LFANPERERRAGVNACETEKSARRLRSGFANHKTQRIKISSHSQPKRVLFVCSRNRLRSPTAEEIFSSYPDWEVASAGLSPDAEVLLDSELVEWAELIFVMEKIHRTRLTRQFSRYLRDKRVVCLDIPDEFDYMQPELVELIKVKLKAFL